MEPLFIYFFHFFTLSNVDFYHRISQDDRDDYALYIYIHIHIYIYTHIYWPPEREFIRTEHDHSIYTRRYCRRRRKQFIIQKGFFCFRNKVHYARANPRTAERLFNVCHRVSVNPLSPTARRSFPHRVHLQTWSTRCDRGRN